jgi:type I site-specific deoxyribonuclease specificity subunit
MEKKKPQIRFNGFEEEWVTTTLGDIAVRVVSKNDDNGVILPLTISAQYGLISQTEFFNSRIAAKDVRGYYVIKKGEFAYNRSTSEFSPFGAVKRLDRYDAGVLSTLYIVFRLSSEQIQSNYLVNYFSTSNWHQYIAENAAEGARNHGLLNITAEDFLKTPIKAPIVPEEQKKIASFLTTLDKLIAKLEAKLDKLRKLKQALLEKMFINVNGGYKAPQIRFKGYTDKWQVKELGEVAIFNPPNQPLRERFYYIDLESVEKGSLKVKEQVTKRMAPSRAQRTLEFNDILFQTVRPYLQNHYLFKKKTQNNQWVASTGYALLRPKIYPELLYTMLLSKGFMQEIMQRCTGSTYPAINSKKMIDIKVGCSSVQMEQQLIGDLFILLDDQLNKTSTKLTKLRNIKQSLLQKMFA